MNGRTFHRLAASVAVLAVVGAVALAGSHAQEPPPQQRGGPPAGMPDLVGGLKDVEGCLGVETVRTASGKQAIFAWFTSKEAVLRWYYSDMHMGTIAALTEGGGEARKPLEKVPAGTGPIMVIATITPSTNPKFETIDLPISQISIELYQPLPGGAFLGGRFAPSSVKVEHMADYTPVEATQGGQ